MKLLMFCLLGICLSTLVYSQENFLPGYIIHLNGDTTYGEIDARQENLMGTQCIFRSSSSATSVMYTPNDLTAYRFINSRYYISQEVESERVFLEYLIKGQLNIYYLRKEDADYFYMEKEDQKLIALPYIEELRYEENMSQPFMYRSNIHYGLLEAITNDAPELSSRVQNIRKPNRKNLVKFAEDYHERVCEGESCIVFEQKEPWLKIDIEPSFGRVLFGNTSDISPNPAFSQGVYLHLRSNRGLRQLFFRTGFILSNISTSEGKFWLHKIPFYVEYQYPKGIFQPKAAVGINAYRRMSFVTMGGMIGSNIKLTKSVHLSFNYDAERLFFPNEGGAFYEKGFYLHTISAGLYFRLGKQE